MASPIPNRIALLQTCATDDVAANLAQVQRLAVQASAGGASTLFLPEAFAFIGSAAHKLRITEPLPAGGPVLRFCQQLATRLGCELLLGGFHERLPATDKSANTTVHISAAGTLKARYRKIHLFDVCLEDGTVLAESDSTIGGNQLVTTSLPCGLLGLTICYDLRFPLLYQRLADAGVSAIAVPSAFTQTTGAAHWHTLLRARAIECQCYIIAAAQYGQHNDQRTSYGHSLVVDPWGDIVAEGPAAAEAVIFADLDPEAVARVRRQMPCRSHRRTFSASNLLTQEFGSSA